MRRTLLILTLAAACGQPAERSASTAQPRSEKLVRARSAIAGQYVVVLGDGEASADLGETAQALASRHGGTLLQVYGAAVNGFAVRMAAADAWRLAEEPTVRFVEEDAWVRAAAAPAPGEAAPPATLPAGSGVNLYVLDTGVRLDHAELAGRAAAAWPDLLVPPGTADCSGHGTWVAALAAGATTGAAPGASVRSVQVLGCDGAGPISSVLAGMDWVARNRVAPAVALLAASSAPSPVLDEAVARVVASGLPFVVAAGNGGGDACDASPGRAPDALTVGGVAAAAEGSPTPYGALALSNGGACVDLLAPGASLASAWNTDATSTQTMSGTSGAAARAAGAAAAFLELNPAATPARVARALAGTALVGGVSGLPPGTPNRVVRPEAVRAGLDDETAPVVRIDVPSAGATIGGTVTLAASATDDVGVTQVAFYLDGAFLAADASVPFEAQWDTSAAGNGPRVLLARAYDAAGNEGVSASVEVTVENPGFAVFDPALGSPRCPSAEATCDSGPVLGGRGSVGPERNASNTIGLPCADGSAGFFHLDESIDGIRVASLDGSPMAVGKGIEITVQAWAYADFAADAVDLYLAPDAEAPVWEHVTTLTPKAAGAQVLRFRHTLGEGNVQALRAAMRFGGAPASCTSGLYDDRDDLVFAVGAGTKDVTTPEVTLTAPTPGAVLGGATRLAATATDESGVVNRVEFVVDGAIVATATVPVDGGTTFEAAWDAASIGDGPHQILARAVDGAGNVQESGPIAFEVADVVAPSVAVAAPEAGQAVGWTVNLVAEASDDRAVTRVSFYADGVLLGSRTAPPWALSWSTGSRVGSVTLTARAWDAAGHQTVSAPVGVVVDHAAPAVAITSPVEDEIVSATVNLTCTLDDDLAGGDTAIANVRKVEFLLDGVPIATDPRAYPTAPCVASWRAGSYPNGRHVLVARATDEAGNVGTSAPVAVEVRDDTAPVVSVAAPPDGGTVGGVAEVTVVASDDGLMERVEVAIDSAPASVFTSPPYSMPIDTALVPDGLHALTATAWDAAGNASSVSSTFWVDNTPPFVQFTAPGAAAGVSGTYTLKANATDAQQVAYVQFWVGSTVLAADSETPYEADFVTTAVDNGVYEVAAIAFDAAGNAMTSAVVPLTVWNATTADHQASRGAPACAEVVPWCFSGSLLRSRGTIQPEGEPNAPNTIGPACEDGDLGVYGQDESIEGITVRTQDGGVLAPGRPVTADVTFRAVSTELDRVDLFYAADANDPAWVWFATLVPAEVGLQTMSASWTLPTGPVQAVRAAARFAENGPAVCPGGSYDDRDDLVFAVATPGVDQSAPAVSLESPSDGGTVHGVVFVGAAAADDSGIARVEFTVDGSLVATDAVPPYGFDWDSAGFPNGLRRLGAVAYDTSGNTTASNPVFVTVASAANAAYDAGLEAPACAVASSFCDAGDLLAGRAMLGPEVNAPNTVGGSCPDGEMGAYLREESVEKIVVRTRDGQPLGPGREALVEVTVHASSAYGLDALDLYHATDAETPAWRPIATLHPDRAGLQALTAVYPLPPGARQVVRARFRYAGFPAACGTVSAGGAVDLGSYDDHDDLVFLMPYVANATWDGALKVPRCTDGRAYCDSGTLLAGRAGLGPEAHAPNTLGGSCPDGADGTWLVDPSIERLRVYAMDGEPLRAGQRVAVEVAVVASDAFADEAIDLLTTDDPLSAAPTWTLAGTLLPVQQGRQTLYAELSLSGAAVQGVRASHRALADAPDPCTSGSVDDHDDLVFAVAP